MISFGEPSYEEIISYQELSDIVEKQHADEPDPDECLYTFKIIISHHGPYKISDPEYRGSRWNVKIEWEDGSQILNHCPKLVLMTLPSVLNMQRIITFLTLLDGSNSNVLQEDQNYNN